MRVLIDTNVIIDVLQRREKYSEEAMKIFELCEIKKVEGYISALSIPNIVYIMRKELDTEGIADVVDTLLQIFMVVDLKRDDLSKALKLRFDDYEDALQSASAMQIKADYIITRNIKDFTKSPIKPILPSNFLEKIIHVNYF